MKMRTVLAVAAGATVLGLSQVAMAHPGHGAQGGFVAGAVHPLTGLDHILAMVAVGLCAAQIGRRAMWLLPLTFVVALVAGAALAGGGSLPMVEQAIAVSVLVLGLMVAMGSRIALPAAMGLVGLFGFFHGYAHGAEMGAATATCAGFVLSSVMLHGAGVGLGLALRQKTKIWRVAGGAMAVCGIVMLCM